MIDYPATILLIYAISVPIMGLCMGLDPKPIEGIDLFGLLLMFVFSPLIGWIALGETIRKGLAARKADAIQSATHLTPQEKKL